MAASETSKEALWLRELVGIFGIIQNLAQVDYEVRVPYISLRITSITRYVIGL